VCFWQEPTGDQPFAADSVQKLPDRAVIEALGGRLGHEAKIDVDGVPVNGTNPGPICCQREALLVARANQFLEFGLGECHAMRRESGEQAGEVGETRPVERDAERGWIMAQRKGDQLASANLRAETIGKLSCVARVKLLTI
jgi:hypothetical protein